MTVQDSVIAKAVEAINRNEDDLEGILEDLIISLPDTQKMEFWSKLQLITGLTFSEILG
jgi:hypothetical protein